jgi:hypothetical protein
VFPTAWFVKTLIPAAALAASAFLPAAPAGAADLGVDYEYGARPVAPYGIRRHSERFEELPPAHGRVIERRTEIENCRLVVRRRVNKFGEEVLRQARVCEDEEPVAYRRPRLALPRDVDRDDTFGSPELVPPADIPYEENGLR